MSGSSSLEEAGAAEVAAGVVDVVVGVVWPASCSVVVAGDSV